MHHPIAIVGSGAVARALGSALHRAGASIAAVASRDPHRATATALVIGDTVRAVRIAEVPALAAHVVIATLDSRISAVAQELADAGFAHGVAVHTCGAYGPESLAPLTRAGVACATFHPLQTIPQTANEVSFAGIAFAITGDPSAEDWATSLCRLLEASVIRPRHDRMTLYHASAALAGNGVTALLEAGVTMMERAGIDRGAAQVALGPLMRTALDNALASTPEQSVTGPVVRGDVATVESHLQAMEADSRDSLRLYRAICVELIGLARRRGLAPEALDSLRTLIDPPQEKDDV